MGKIEKKLADTVSLQACPMFKLSQIEHEEGAGTSSNNRNYEAANGIAQVCWSDESFGDSQSLWAGRV